MNTFPTTRSSIVTAIKTFATQKSLIDGKSIHAHVIKLCVLPETQLHNHLLNMYSKCFDFDSARKLFDEMPEPNLVSYSALISGYSQSDTPERALGCAIDLRGKGLILNHYVFSSLILACSKMDCVKQGKQIHGQVIVCEYESDKFVRTNLAEMYLKSGDLESAISIFRLSLVRDSIMFNSMISGLVSYGMYGEAVELFNEARSEVGLKTSEFTLGSVIKACSNLNIEIGGQIHGFGMKTGFTSNCIVGTSFVDMYGKFGDMENAWNVFGLIQYLDLPLYNSMIVGLSNNNMFEAALEIFSKVIIDGFSPNDVTFSSVLKSCGGLRCIDVGKIIHGLVFKSDFCKDLVVSTAMIDAYMKCGFVKDGIKLFHLLSDRNAVLYNSMIYGLGQFEDWDGAVIMFIDMKRKGINPNIATFVSLLNSTVGHEMPVFAHVITHGFGHDLMVQNSLLDSLIKIGFVDESLLLFNEMSDRNVISWTSIISGLSELGLVSYAISLFKDMKSKGVSPNSFTFSSLFKACGNLADLEIGKCIHGCAIKHGTINDKYTNSSLLDMYARCGAVDESYKIFDTMAKKDVVMCNSMITAFSRHGKGQEAVKLLGKMEYDGIEPNKMTFTSLLSACSHCGLIDEGIFIFDSITNKHNKVPSTEHYSCMVDIFGRARMLDRAKSLIENMPYEADKSVWMTFLAACKLHGDLGNAEFASERVMSLEGGDNSTLISLSNIYSEWDKWEDVDRVRRRVREVGVKNAGVSWVQIRG